MPKLTWGANEARYYEVGIDRGVLYPRVGPGVAWNGLVSVSESIGGGEVRPTYLDGQKIRNRITSEEFGATITAFSSPREFDVCDGTAMLANGLYVTQQPRQKFGFAYRTLIGEGAKGHGRNYKIHLIYNAMASPSAPEYSTLGSSADPTSLTWEITTIPASGGFKPSAHFVVDSRTAPLGLLQDLEDILYGSASATPRLPTPTELVSLFSSFIVIDGGHAGAIHSSFVDGGLSDDIHESIITGGSA